MVNLDVEQYLFRPREQLPGQLTRALREFLALQRRTGLDKQGEPYSISAFMLMFTTQVGPSGLPEDYIEYLRDTCIEGNLNRYAELREPFLAKSNGKDAATFFDEDFDSAFKLAIPKSLSELAWETDWYIDGQRGIEVFQFDRQWKEGSYRMLHLAMMLRRQDPPQGRRGPGQVSATAAAEHRRVINGIFMGEVVAVESLVTGHLKNDLEQDLLQLFQHRARYYTPPPE